MQSTTCLFLSTACVLSHFEQLHEGRGGYRGWATGAVVLCNQGTTENLRVGHESLHILELLKFAMPTSR